MRAVLQRVRSASVGVRGACVSAIGRGLLVLLGVTKDDDKEAATLLADKIAALRIFEDAEGKMNLSIRDVSGEALVVSQFTLYADCRKGRRPSFTSSAPPDQAKELYERFCDLLTKSGVPTSRGQFGEKMIVTLENDGPVTIVLDTLLL
ncbi:MAG: D-tyrosyl-tRNA(Tyr) deacylase [Candidatus Coatesbacteria bacterium]|nr:D-tyrosyl-tRNA(Tyr) deacylase [Candidatus Coatesbacteria bacterium]